MERYSTHDRPSPVVRWMSRAVAIGIFLLLVAGALVTSTESGLAVPDWPLSYGRLMPPMVGGIFYEHGHRLVAAGMSTLVGIQVAVLFWGEKRRLLRRLGLLAFGAILLQAVLGGLTVLYLLPPAVSSAHAGLAQIVFALTSSIALMTSATYLEGNLGAHDPAALARTLRRVTWATAAVYVQILLGAVMRHTAAGLVVPDFPLSFGRLFPTAAELARRGVAIHMAHRLFAVVAAVLVVAAILALRKLPGLFSRLGLLWGGLLLVQLLLGAASIWTKKAVPVTTAHLAVGALCFVTGVLTALLLRRAGSALPERSAAPAGAEPVPA